MQQLEERRDMPARRSNAQMSNAAQSEDKSKEESSFEDLSTDLLYSKFRFVIVDCRLNTLQQEVALPHCLSESLPWLMTVPRLCFGDCT